MPAQWTADLIGEMHLKGITQRKLAEHLGYTNEYISMVLSGKRTPKNAEQVFRKAVDDLSAGST